MSYNISYSPEAVKQIKNFDKPVKLQILKKIAGLQENSELGKPLGNILKNHRSLHIGKYRAIYSIRGTEILVAKIEHRKTVYT